MVNSRLWPSHSQRQAASYPARKMQTWPATDKTFLVNGKKTLALTSALYKSLMLNS